MPINIISDSLIAFFIVLGLFSLFFSLFIPGLFPIQGSRNVTVILSGSDNVARLQNTLVGLDWLNRSYVRNMSVIIIRQGDNMDDIVSKEFSSHIRRVDSPDCLPELLRDSYCHRE